VPLAWDGESRFLLSASGCYAEWSVGTPFSVRRAWQGIWWLSWLHDSLFVVVLVIGGPIACIVGLVMGDWQIVGLGALAVFVGVALAVVLAKETSRAPKARP
jgi:hypothetical protein